MKVKRLARMAGIAIVVSVFVLLSGCLGGVGLSGNSDATPGVSKPKPSVESVNAATSGMNASYYAILDIEVKNDGADGTVMLTGRVTQGGQTGSNEMPVYLARGAKQTIRLVLPLKWQGGDWTAAAEVRVP